MQDNRKTKPKLRKNNERRKDMQIIRTSVSEKEIYAWALCIAIISIILTVFIFLGFTRGA